MAERAVAGDGEHDVDFAADNLALEWCDEPDAGNRGFSAKQRPPAEQQDAEEETEGGTQNAQAVTARGWA